MSKFILPGSLDIDTFPLITAGVHTGKSEWEVEGLRFIKADVSDFDKTRTVLDILSEVYDRSTGDLVAGDFKDKGEA